jgi:hypothetical protein
MFDSKRLISFVVRDSDGQRVFWATSAREYASLSQTQGLPETGTIVTLDRDGHCAEYTVPAFQDLLNEEGLAHAETMAMLQGCMAPDEVYPEHDYELLEHARMLAGADQRQVAVTPADLEDTTW